MKIAFDVHGVLDKSNVYRSLLRSLVLEDANEIFIISGQPYDAEMLKLLSGYNLVNSFDHYCSIETTLMLAGVPYEIRVDEEGKEHKYFADEVWNPVKARLCEYHGIDIIFDNSEIYAPYFEDINTVFNLVKL